MPHRWRTCARSSRGARGAPRLRADPGVRTTYAARASGGCEQRTRLRGSHVPTVTCVAGSHVSASLGRRRGFAAEQYEPGREGDLSPGRAGQLSRRGWQTGRWTEKRTESRTAPALCPHGTGLQTHRHWKWARKLR